MTALALPIAAVEHLITGNDVTVEWVSSADPMRTTTTMGKVVAISTETVHIQPTLSAHPKIINLTRVTGVWVHGLGAAALHRQAAAAEKLHHAADAMARGDIAGAAAMLATALHFAPHLREEAL